MTCKPSVLVVAPTARIAATVFAWLTDAGFTPLLASSFAAAKQQIDEHPSLLVSEVRLGEYNGLHLALRAQARGVPAILIGEADLVLQREAAQLGASYLTGILGGQDLLTAVEPVIETAVEHPWVTEPALPLISTGENPQRHPNPFRS